MSEFASTTVPVETDKDTVTESLSQLGLNSDNNRNSNDNNCNNDNDKSIKNTVEETNSADEIIEVDRDEIDLARALAAKEEGNQYFRNKDYDEAIVKYSEAIEFCPKNYNSYSTTYGNSKNNKNSNSNNNNSKNNSKEEVFHKEDNAEDSEETKPELHKYAEQLATFYGNRSAAYFSIEEYELVVDDCTDALELKPNYVKVLIRRYQAYEKLDKIEDALADAKKVQELEPTYPKIREIVNRLQRLYDERMNKLKDEALGKLKDLGNSILGTFGMSLDNFKMQQDPNSGSWNISMNK